MSEYWGIPLLPFFSCAPAEKVPRFVFDLLSPSVKHEGGVATMAPYGLRKLEASLLRDHQPQDTLSHIRIFNENYWFPAYTLIVGLQGEEREDSIETVRLIDRMESVLRKDIGDRAHFTVTRLSFVPLGVLKREGFFNIDDGMDEARFWVIYRSWRHTVLELHTMPPTLMKLNPVLKSIFTMLCWFGSQKILDAIKAWGRAMGYDADKSLRLGVPEKVPVLA